MLYLDIVVEAIVDFTWTLVPMSPYHDYFDDFDIIDVVSGTDLLLVYTIISMCTFIIKKENLCQHPT